MTIYGHGEVIDVLAAVIAHCLLERRTLICVLCVYFSNRDLK